MSRNRWLALIGVAALVAGCAPAGRRAEKPEALECMKRFHIDKFVVGCWMWGDAPYRDDDRYFRELKEAGFNTVLAGPGDFERVRKFGLKMVFATGGAVPAGTVKLPPEKYGNVPAYHYARLPELQWISEQYGSNPDIIGYHLNDNCSVHDYSVECTEWLLKNWPDKVPWMSTNPNPIVQSETPMCILSTQNYPFGTGANSPEEWQRRTFCNVCDRDRELANRRNMAVWMVISCQAHSETPSQYRFQVNVSAAYGAQGVWVFAYNRHFRPVLNATAGPTHRYVTDIAGPHLLPRRAVAVYHTAPDLPADYAAPAKGKLIEGMSEGLMAGVFVKETEIKKGMDAPDYVYVVDKRAVKLPADARPKDKKEFAEIAYKNDPPPRATEIRFGPRVRAVEVLLADGSTKRYKVTPGTAVPLPALRGGEAVMLRIDAAAMKMPEVHPEVMAMPAKWKLSLDRQNVSGKEKWAAVDFDDSKWGEIRADEPGGWGRYEGQGWYRLKFTAPPGMLRKHMYLNFGAADEEATVYIDGEAACLHTRAATGLGLGEIWSRPFSFECGKWLGDGKEHTIAVQVVNYWGAGGLYKPVHLVASDEPLEPGQILKVLEDRAKAK